MRDGRDKRHTTDENGDTWLVDKDGHRIGVPGPAKELTTDSGFRHYDTSRGHCGLCGSLTCTGSCFK